MIMETLAPGDDITLHRKQKKRKGVSEDTAPVDMPKNNEEELNHKKKKKRRREEKCIESLEGIGGDIILQEEVCQSNSQETRERKKGKNKEEKEMNETAEAESQTSVTMETNITRKKKKHKNRPAEDSVVVITTDDENQDSVVVLEESPVPMATSKTKKHVKKKKRCVVAEETPEASTPDAELDEEHVEGGPAIHGAPQEVVSVTKGKKKKKKKKKRVRKGREEVEESVREDVGGEGVEQSAPPTDGPSEMTIVDNADLAELQTYYPDILSRPAIIIYKMLRYDMPRFREFRNKGIDLRNGRYLVSENQKIRKNVADFLALTGIDTADQLFFPERHTQKDEHIRKLRVQYRFLERIAEGIPRPCHKVYSRAKKMFDHLNYLGRFSEDENRQLKMLQQIHGNSWKTISPLMDRSLSSLQKRFVTLSFSKGPWSKEEHDIFIGVMKTHLEKLAAKSHPGSDPAQPWLTRKQLCNNLPWKFVSEQVKTRSWLQCREKWFGFLKYRLVVGQQAALSRGPKHAYSKITLINTLYLMNVEDVAEVDWEKVADSIGNVTPWDAQRALHVLKMTKVPHSSSLSFCEVIDFLQEKVVPELMRKLNTLKEPCALREEVQDRFCLSSIFTDDEEYLELDNTAPDHPQLDHNPPDSEEI